MLILNANKFENLDKIDTFLGKNCKLPNLRRNRKLNIPLTIKEIELVISNLLITSPDNFINKLYQSFGE